MNDKKRLLLKYIQKRDKLEAQLEEVEEIIESMRQKNFTNMREEEITER